MRSALLTMEGNENHSSCLTTTVSLGVRLASDVVFSANVGLLEQLSCRSVEKRFINLYLASDQGPEATAV